MINKRRAVARILSHLTSFIFGAILVRGYFLISIVLLILIFWNFHLIFIKHVWDDESKTTMHIIQKDIFRMYHCRCEDCKK